MTELVLHEACAVGDYESLEENLKTGKHDPNCRDEEWGGKTPLHWTAITGSIDCCRLLLSIGVNGNIKMDNGWTAAHCAAESGRIYILRALHGAAVRLDEKDYAGDTAMDVARMYGQLECVQFLLEIYEEYATGIVRTPTPPTVTIRSSWKQTKRKSGKCNIPSATF